MMIVSSSRSLTGWPPAGAVLVSHRIVVGARAARNCRQPDDGDDDASQSTGAAAVDNGGGEDSSGSGADDDGEQQQLSAKQ